MLRYYVFEARITPPGGGEPLTQEYRVEAQYDFRQAEQFALVMAIQDHPGQRIQVRYVSMWPYKEARDAE